jgi:hypothetical protein
MKNNSLIETPYKVSHSDDQLNLNLLDYDQLAQRLPKFTKP